MSRTLCTAIRRMDGERTELCVFTEKDTASTSSYMTCMYVHKIKQGQRRQLLSNIAINIISLTPWYLKLRVHVGNLHFT